MALGEILTFRHGRERAFCSDARGNRRINCGPSGFYRVSLGRDMLHRTRVNSGKQVGTAARIWPP